MKILTSAHYLDFSYPFQFNLEYRFFIVIELGNKVGQIMFEKNSAFQVHSNQEKIKLNISTYDLDKFIFDTQSDFFNSHNLDDFTKKEDFIEKIKEDLNNSLCDWPNFYEKSLINFKKKYPQCPFNSFEETQEINNNFIKQSSILLDYILKIADKENSDDLKNMELLELNPFLKDLNYIDIRGSIKNNNKLIEKKIKI